MSGELIRVVATIIIAAVLITTIRARAAEYSLLLVLAVVVVVIICVFGNLFGAIVRLRDLFNKSGNASIYFTTALKALGISYISTFAADMCRDYGLSVLAQTAETAGKVTIFLLSLPLVITVLETALKFVDL